MKTQPWLIPVMIGVYIVIRILIAVRRQKDFRKNGPPDPQADRRRILIKFFWLILLIAFLGLLYFAPKRPAPTANPEPGPTPAPSAQPAGKP